MKVAMDSNAFTLQRYGGVSRYLVRLAQELGTMGHDVRVHGLLHINRYLDEARAGLTWMHRIDSFPRFTRRATHFANDLWTNLRLAGDRADLIHESYCHNRRVGPSDLPRVCTVHDLIHDLFPQYWGKMDRTPEYRRATIARADAVICVSESTRRDLLRLTDLDPSKAHVVHHGFELAGSTAALGDEEQREFESLTKDPYLLYVGGRNNYKNFRGFLEGYALTGALDSHGIVAFGGGVLREDELMRLDALGIPREKVQQSSGSDSLLRFLYRHAAAFVYPSLYEGFGFPPLEAMAEDCPVLASNASCIPEVVGEAAEFFDPEDSSSIARAISRVLTSAELRDDLRVRGRKRLEAFSWKKCASETLDVYYSVLAR